MVEINTKTEDEYCIITVDGEVDASSSIFLDESLNEAIQSHTRILVDCKKLEYISSAGLGVFMSYIKELEQKEIGMALFGLNEKVFHVFQILGLDQLLTIVKSVEEAKEKVNGV